jgi:DNA-binding LacI/PurR family transcriptional regulator
MQQLLDAPGPRPDAVFAYNDAAALAAQRVCLARGLRIPDDIAIVGFDDIPAAAHANPPLTTLAVDKEALGRRGVELLLAESPEHTEISLPVELIVRASSQSAGSPALDTATVTES